MVETTELTSGEGRVELNTTQPNALLKRDKKKFGEMIDVSNTIDIDIRDPASFGVFYPFYEFFNKVRILARESLGLAIEPDL